MISLIFEWCYINVKMQFLLSDVLQSKLTISSVL